MHSLMRQLLTICILLTMAAMHINARRPFIPGKSKPAPVSQPTQDTRAPDANMADIERRMADVELSTSVMKREMHETQAENRRLQAEVRSMGALMRELDKAHRRVEELQRMLRYFESFFGILYTNQPEIFEQEIDVDRRMSALNEYIGNREAELVALRPNPPFVVEPPSDNPVDEELVGVVVQELSSENARLKRRMDSMESMITSPTDTDGRPVLTAGKPDEETQDRLTRLERMVALQLSPLLDQGAGSSASKTAANEGAAQQLGLSESDTEILREELESARGITSTRKSLFSAAALGSTKGMQSVHNVVQFDHVYSNKGNHFREHNSTFICHIQGFYYFTFSVRSYDTLLLGVNLLKNGKHVTSVSGESHPTRNQMMSQTVILHLKQGDKVWLTVSPSIKYAVYSDHSKYCTFSGFLLFKGS